MFSDLLVERPGLVKGIKLLRQRGHDVLVLHVMDDDELDFPFAGPTRFDGLELPDHVSGVWLDAIKQTLHDAAAEEATKLEAIRAAIE